VSRSIRSGAQLLNTRSATNHALIGRVINQKDRHMFTMLTVIRKKSEVTTDDFRHFMEFEYGPTYSGLPQTREYVQYYLSDVTNDGGEPAIDAIVQISFDSPEKMKKALLTESYKKAHKLREAFMQETSVGIHSAVKDRKIGLMLPKRSESRDLRSELIAAAVPMSAETHSVVVPSLRSIARERRRDPGV
jgi:hypothetical protein